MRKILITGANSYIGVSFQKYAEKHYGSELCIDTVDMVDASWREKEFNQYDVVFHVAGIAHADVGNVSEEIKSKYYAVNTELAIETARKAKESGIKQFIFMSSAIIYGDSAPVGKRKIITDKTEPAPSNFYGDSKWKADQGIRELEDENFKVVIIRPPMIYGKNCKGNYPLLSKMSRKMLIFPAIENQRSMLYIENLCEFLCQVIMRMERGVFWPQNSEYVKTTELVRIISKFYNHNIVISKIWNWPVVIASHIPGKISGLANKAFGSLCYDQEMSQYGFDYQVYDLKTSIERTERE